MRKVSIRLSTTVVALESFQLRCLYQLFLHDNREGYVSKIVGRMQKEYREFTGGEELRVFFEKDEISGYDRQRRTLEAIRSCRLLLVCLSPDYLESDYCSREFYERLTCEATRGPLVESIGPIYFVEIPALCDKGFEQRAAEWVGGFRRRQHFEFRPWFDDGAADLKETAIKALLRDAHRVVEANGNVDRHNEHFVGRSAELRRLREIVAFEKLGAITVINGTDGVGKTALAIEYCHAFIHEYLGGCWRISCQGCEDLRVCLASLAGARDLEYDFAEEKRGFELVFERVLSRIKPACPLP